MLRQQGAGSKSAKVVRCSTAATAPFHAAGLGADLAGSQEKGADAAPCMHKHSPSAASVRTTDSDQSAGSVISMSESASDRCGLCSLKLWRQPYASMLALAFLVSPSKAFVAPITSKHASHTHHLTDSTTIFHAAAWDILRGGLCCVVLMC